MPAAQTKGVRVLIDGDPLVYRCGFAAENRWKILSWREVRDPEDPRQDVLHERFFDYVWAMEDFIEEHGLVPEECEIQTWLDPLSEAYTLKITKDAVSNILEAIEGYLANSGRGVGEYQLYLSGSTNFRDKIATIPCFRKDGTAIEGYKGNRKGAPRPFWYSRIRQYMVEVWGATIVEGMEADDALAIEQWSEDEYEQNTVICSVDKDLKNVPGWHYDVVKKTEEFISYQDAQVHFYRQLLTGDPTDNIPGCYRVGKTKAKKLIHKDMGADEMFAACLAVYEENVEKYPERHGGLSAEESILENGRLLWMLQHDDQLWNTPLLADGSLQKEGYMNFAEGGDEW